MASNYMSKSILFTGGADFTGSNIVKFLVNEYHDFRIINVYELFMLKI